MMTDQTQSEEKKGFRTLFKESDIPIVVYLVVLLGMGAAWWFQAYHPDLGLNLFSELLGAAFTLFIVDSLLVRSKIKRWKIVQSHIDYLISRDVNRIRDGIATRIFRFVPELAENKPENDQLESIRNQRAKLLSELESMKETDFQSKIHDKSLFTEESYDYFSEKAGDIWNILNMKYSEYLNPELVSSLIGLHINLKDLCGHLRQYKKAERFPADRVYYHRVGKKGAAISLIEILKIVNYLKQNGYSTPASLFDTEQLYNITGV
jgi:hypothetical protein